MPVYSTNAIAVPLTTTVPIKREFDLSLIGIFAERILADFSAGKLSPVNVASLTKRLDFHPTFISPKN